MSNAHLPDARQLQELLALLEIDPLEEIKSLIEFQKEVDHTDFTSHIQEQIESLRQSIYLTRNQEQIGLFAFWHGLTFLRYRRYDDAASCFDKAYRQWLFYGEKPHICLADFATGAAYAYDVRGQKAARIFARVERELKKMAAKLKEPRLVPSPVDYKQLVEDLLEMVQTARKDAPLEIYTVPHPRIHGELQDRPDDQESQSLPTGSQTAAGLVHLLSEIPEQTLRQISSAINVDYDKLSGDTQPERVRALVNRAASQQKLSQLKSQLESEAVQEVSEEHFVAPAPVFEEEWFTVAEEAADFLPGILAGDSLLVRRDRPRGSGYCVVKGDSSVQTSIRVQPEPLRPEETKESPYYLAWFIRDEGGQVRVFTRANKTEQVDPNVIEGRVIRRCKNI